MEAQLSLFSDENKEKDLEKRVEQKAPDIDLQQRLEQRRKEFEAKYMYGSTTVIYHNNTFYFWGDISHCGEESIFHNARTMRDEMLKNKMSYGHMSYNDPPRYEKPGWDSRRDFTRSKNINSFWELKEWERKSIYHDDLYMFKGDEVVLVESEVKTR
jgi:hypothetical protein